MKKKKILIMTSIFPPEIGGPATYAKSFFQNIKDLDSFSLISSYSNEKFKQNNNIDHLQFKGIKFIRPFQFLYYFLKKRKNIKTIFFLSSPQDFFITIIIAKLLNIKTVQRIGGEFHKEFLHNNSTIINKIKSFILLNIEKLLYYFTDSYICVSNIMEQYLNSIGIYNKINIIENFVENKSSKSVVKNLSYPIKILTVSRLIKRKNIHEIIQKTISNKNFELHIVGNGPEYKKLYNLAKNHLDRIFFYNSLSKDEIFRLFKKCHFFILNSYKGEGFPNAVLEALAYNIPVLTTDHVLETGVVSKKNAFVYKNINDAFSFMIKNYKKDLYNKITKNTILLKKNTFEHHLKEINKILIH